jgi:CBASS immunity sensor of nucleotide second messenger signals
MKKSRSPKLAPPTGIILIAHEVLSAISQEEIMLALPEAYRGLPRQPVHLRSVKTTLAEIGNFDWFTARRQMRAEVDEILEPLLREHPNWRPQYFGAAPIPLAMDLGYLIGGQGAVDVYQQRHDTHEWAWQTEELSPQVRFRRTALPGERVTAEGDVVVRVSISHRIDRAETAEVIPQTLGEFDIELMSPNEDALTSQADLAAVKERFDRVIDSIHDKRPNARIHVFAAVTVGVAFRLGTAVNPTIHGPIYVYQYSVATSPRYARVLVLQRLAASRAPLSEDEIRRVGAFRATVAADLKALQAGIARLREHDVARSTWLSNIFPDNDVGDFHGAIVRLAKIFDTPLRDSAIDLTNPAPPDGFRLDYASRQWQLDDRLLLAIENQFRDALEAKRAVRLLLLHEAVHAASHNLTEATAQQIRRFPKILEEVDYQADVWGFLHEWALQQPTLPESEARSFFLRVLETAVETFWAFDVGSENDRIEIRRLNRYLIWYWQFLRIEKCSSISDILRVFSERPVIEIAGPRVSSEDNRTFYWLDERMLGQPELGVLIGNRVYRYGNAPGPRVADIFSGFRERDGEKIRFALRSIFDQLTD